jgi:hypothetical protein
VIGAILRDASRAKVATVILKNRQRRRAAQTGKMGCFWPLADCGQNMVGERRVEIILLKVC